MKLIIEIPTETYGYWKEHKYEYVLSEAIANGIPYNPTGDCEGCPYCPNSNSGIPIGVE